MRTIRLGRTDLDVSRVAFGTWQLSGDWGDFDTDAAVTAIRHARELGVTLFDTAYGYGEGRSEEVLGKGLRDDLDHRRDEVVIATKGGIRPGTERPRDAGRAELTTQVDASLRALGVDHIDVYQIHWPDADTPAAETAGVLQEFVDAGKIRHVGVSNYDADQLADFEQHRPVETLQPPYHLFRRGIEDSILPWCRAHDVGVLVYSPLGSGLLTGRLTPDSTFADDDWRAQSDGFRGETLRVNLAVVDQLKEIASGKGISVGQLAIAWALAQDGVHVAIVGARSARNIEDSVGAADVDLTGDELAEISRLSLTGRQIDDAASPEGVV